MTYVYAGAADWGGKDPAKCNRGLYRLATGTGTWTTLERGLPDQVEACCVTLHPTQPGVVFAGTQAGPYLTVEAAQNAGAVTFNYGVFINTVISFTIVAFAVFLLIRAINRLKREEEAKPPAAPAEEIVLLREIRDSLKKS